MVGLCVYTPCVVTVREFFFLAAERARRPPTAADDEPGGGDGSLAHERHERSAVDTLRFFCLQRVHR